LNTQQETQLGASTECCALPKDTNFGRDGCCAKC